MSLTHKIFIACVCIAFFSACKKDKPTPDNYISYKLDGVYAKLKPEADYYDDNTFLVDAGPFEKGEMGLFLDTIVQIKTYDLANSKDNALGDYYDKSGTHFWSDSGTLVVNSFDGKNISGTFAFRARTEDGKPATIHVTEGQFVAKVSYLSFSPDTCSLCDSTLYAVIGRRRLIGSYLRHLQLPSGNSRRRN